MKHDVSKIVKVYGNTLFEEAVHHKKLEQIYTDSKTLLEEINENDYLHLFFKSGIIKEADKLVVFSKIEKKLELHILTLKFIKFLIQCKRELYIKDIFLAFQNIYFEYNQIAQINITSVIPLTEKDITSIKNKIKNQLKIKDTVVNVQLNKNLIGGLIIEIDGKLLDLSIKRQLIEIEKQLLA